MQCAQPHQRLPRAQAGRRHRGGDLGGRSDRRHAGVLGVVPRLFKSFFDVIEKDALAGMPVLIAATGGTPRHSLVLEHALRPLFAHLRAVVVPTGVYAASEDWGAEGLDGRIERAAGELVGLMRGMSGVRVAARDDLAVVPFAERLAALSGPSGA
jgi:FMN reductase